MAPMTLFKIHTTPRQQLSFTAIMGVVMTLSREIYRFIDVPFGVHSIIFIVVELIVMKKLVPSLNWYRVTLFVWLGILIVIITEGIVLMPIMKYYGLQMNQIEADPMLTLLFAGIGSNIGLIIMAIIGKLKGNRIFGG